MGTSRPRNQHTRDVINFYGQTAADLQRELQKSIESYIAFCNERGREPDKPFSGKFLVRVPPAVHRALVITAARNEKSLNRFVAERPARDLELLEEEPTKAKESRRKAKRTGQSAGR